MSNLKLQVICENNVVKSFEKGITGAYFYIGLPTEYDQEPEYILSVFFDEKGDFQGILLKDEYKEILKNQFDSLISCEIPRNIEEYERLNFVEIKEGSISIEEYDLCKCKKCGYLTTWDEGDIWECEECNELICSKCIKEFNEEAKIKGISQLDKILCDTCFEAR